MPTITVNASPDVLHQGKILFANNCAGCHATGVDAKTKTFSAFGIDCYACHAIIPEQHGNDTSLALLSKKNHTSAKVITSLCAQCHLRESKSRSTSGRLRTCC